MLWEHALKTRAETWREAGATHKHLQEEERVTPSDPSLTCLPRSCTVGGEARQAPAKQHLNRPKSTFSSFLCPLVFSLGGELSGLTVGFCVELLSCSTGSAL